MSVAVEQAGIDYHVVLAQNALQQCLDQPELQSEFICALVKQTSRHTQHRLGVQVKKAARLASLGTARVVSPAYCLTKTTFNHPVPFLKLKRYSSIVRFFFFLHSDRFHLYLIRIIELSVSIIRSYFFQCGKWYTGYA